METFFIKSSNEQGWGESFILRRDFPPNLSFNSFFYHCCVNRKPLYTSQFQIHNRNRTKLDVNVLVSFRIQKLFFVVNSNLLSGMDVFLRQIFIRSSFLSYSTFYFTVHSWKVSWIVEKKKKNIYFSFFSRTRHSTLTLAFCLNIYSTTWNALEWKSFYVYV